MSEELNKCQKDLSLVSETLKERSQALIEMKGVQKRDVQVQFNKDCGENNTVNINIQFNRIELLNQIIWIFQDYNQLQEECHTIKSENRKIRDQLKLQVQERKLLLKKIRY